MEIIAPFSRTTNPESLMSMLLCKLTVKVSLQPRNIYFIEYWFQITKVVILAILLQYLIIIVLLFSIVDLFMCLLYKFYFGNYDTSSLSQEFGTLFGF